MVRSSLADQEGFYSGPRQQQSGRTLPWPICKAWYNCAGCVGFASNYGSDSPSCNSCAPLDIFILGMKRWKRGWIKPMHAFTPLTMAYTLNKMSNAKDRFQRSFGFYLFSSSSEKCSITIVARYPILLERKTTWELLKMHILKINVLITSNLSQQGMYAISWKGRHPRLSFILDFLLFSFSALIFSRNLDLIMHFFSEGRE